MRDGSVVGEHGPDRNRRRFVAKALGQKVSAVFIYGVLFHEATSPIEHAWRGRLTNGLFTQSRPWRDLLQQSVLVVYGRVVVVFEVAVA